MQRRETGMLRQARKSILVLVAGLVAASALPAAEHTLLIDEDLRANANVLKVRMDVDDDEIWPFLIGGFEVTETRLLLVAAMATILDVKMNVSSDDLGE
jgi:hypothetical protein